MDMPNIRRCFGLFPPKYATFLIAVFGISSGGVGIAGIILFGIAEEKITAWFTSKPDQLNEEIKKMVLVMMGFTSLFLLVGNTFLLIGAITKAKGAVNAGIWILFLLCLLHIIGAMGAPLGCFFMASTCLVKKVSSITVTLGILSVTGFLELWLYFIAVAWNYKNEN